MTLNVMPAARRERASRMQERDGAVGRVAMGPAASRAPSAWTQTIAIERASKHVFKGRQRLVACFVS